MTIEEIMKGESKNVEFKQAIPKNSFKFTKDAVAFANTFGGKIVFGVVDGTHEVVGVDEEDPFKLIDAITSAIEDSIEPMLLPDVTLQTIEDKTVIVVEIPVGRQRPYYIKSMGMQKGTFVRVSGESRQADELMLKELLFEGSNRFFDQTVFLGHKITDKEIEKLCRMMKKTARDNSETPEERRAVKDVTKKQLLKWGILTEKDGEICPTNAYEILTGNEELPVTIQCAVFKGETKAVFLDKKEYTGNVCTLIEEAYKFVLRNIRLAAEIKGTQRKETYEIPMDAIRELIINAVLHRSYLNRGNIQVAVYDNRLELTSPGRLPMGQSIEHMKEGYSVIRNQALAYALYYMKFIEGWGSGYPRLIEMVRKAGLADLEILGGDYEIRVNIFRKGISGKSSVKSSVKSSGKSSGKNSGKGAGNGANKTRAQILKCIEKDAQVTIPEMAQKLSVSTRAIEKNIKDLRESGLLVRHGTARGGYWEIVKTGDKKPAIKNRR